MGVFLDTSFYCGLVDSEDDHAERSIEILKMLKTGKYGQIYTSNYVMAESASLIAIRTNRNPNFMIAMQDVFNGNKTIALLLRSTAIDENDAWELFQKINLAKKNEKIVSYVDCTNITISQAHQIKNIVSFDSHFESWLTVIS